jgi:hypothetical protein
MTHVSCARFVVFAHADAASSESLDVSG